MAEVMEAPRDALDRQDGQSTPAEGSPPPPPPPPPRRRDRDSRERRDDYYESRNRSPLAAARDRDYRRRGSPSSPPYRERRHSSPRRSPPPGGFKRSRREDGGYERHRGSPRYGYDHGGYDRGGRGGYDERLHGRYTNRTSDWPDLRRGSFDGPQHHREGLMTYKQFIQELEDDILPAEAERRYEEYRTEYISTQKRAYFESHKDEEWLKNKYHPTNLVAVIERRNEHARAVAKEVLLDLQSGTLDLGPGFTSFNSTKSGNVSDPNSEDEADVGSKRRRHGRGPAKENDISSASKAHPVSCEPRRIQVDIEQAQALVRKLDSEKGIEDNILSVTDHRLEGDKSRGGSIGPIVIIRGLTTVKGLEGAELLDTLITYLWRVHGIDYYGAIETNEAKGLRHVRPEGKTYEGTNAVGVGADWEKKLDSFWQERLKGLDPLETMTAKEKIDAAAVEVLDPYVRKIRDEKYGWKYGCGAKGCTKLFHAAEFVHKHLRLKHPDLVMELTLKIREDLYFQNYMNDPNSPGGTPIMQQVVPKDKAPKRRSVLDGRLRDERGSHRDHGKGDRTEDERNERGEYSPSRDASEGGDQMHDAYDGLHGSSSFPSDMPLPPPLLMPVPGAGPLGPFVPAPPEVAMRMMREQGGSTALETNGGGGSRGGRKGRSGPLMGPTGPILGIPPAFRHDPRRMRSYQDLDAPEDEVTVMDYRSL